MKHQHLSGQRVLVVEDEAMVSMMLEDLLEEMCCVVAGTAARLDHALRQAETSDIDCAILDLNLDGQLTYPVADILMLRGTPFIFLTGYGHSALPERYQKVPTLHKPFFPQELERWLATIVRPASPPER